jgi:DNA-directed RNA polymerase specialized sigma subunit
MSLQVYGNLTRQFGSQHVGSIDSVGQSLEQQVRYWRTKYETLRDECLEERRYGERRYDECCQLREELLYTQNRIGKLQMELTKAKGLDTASGRQKRHREVLKLRKAGKLYKEIAEVLGVTTPRARQIHLQAMKYERTRHPEHSSD